MNILYINHYAGSIYHGMEYRPYYLAREWVRQGHRVTIIASNLSHIRHKNVEIPLGQDFLTEHIDGIEYIWCRTTPYGENGFKRVVNIFSFLNKVKLLKHKLLTENKPDLVIASSTYPFDTKIASQIAREAGAKFVYEVHDLWPLTPMEVGGMSKWHPFIMAMQRAENYGYRHADKVVSLLPKADKYMQEHGMNQDKFVYISNGVAVDDWLKLGQKIPNEQQILFSRLTDIEKKFIIGYAGGMGESNALKYLIAAAKKIQQQPIAIVLVGDGACKVELQAEVAQEKLHNVHFLPAISKLAIPDFLARCDGLYIGWNKLPIYRFGICPNKLFDYMLAGKPVVHSVTAGNDLVAESGCGISVAAEDSDAIANALVQLSQMTTEQLDRFAANGKQYVLTNHDYRVLATRFLDALNR